MEEVEVREGRRGRCRRGGKEENRVRLGKERGGDKETSGGVKRGREECLLLH